MVNVQATDRQFQPVLLLPVQDFQLRIRFFQNFSGQTQCLSKPFLQITGFQKIEKESRPGDVNHQVLYFSFAA